MKMAFKIFFRGCSVNIYEFSLWVGAYFFQIVKMGIGGSSATETV